MDISIIGSGYVGLVTGACFADVGHHVICVDNDSEKVRQLKAGEVPIYEPGLEEIIHRNVSAQRLQFTGNIQEAVERIFKVKVQHVRTMTVAGKERRRGRYTGYRPDWKKAYVTLREGEKMIEYGENF